MKINISSRIWFISFTVILISLFSFSSLVISQTNVRTEIKIPDIPDYKTLKCDFHMHSVFSDGSVWPTVRVEEAWREGLDAISITDHIEHLSHKTDIPLTDHNRSYEIAKPRADELGLILIKGAEITRDMPPGHFNTIFLNDINPLDTEDWRDAFKAASDQGAFVFWNHPGWRQPAEIPIWYDEHTELFEKGWFQGIEIVNHFSYYPRAFQWALEKSLTLMGNSDVHPPIQMDFNLAYSQHRPMTIVFAREKSEQAIKEALLARRTVVYYNELLLGEEKYLQPIFERSIEILNPNISVKGTGRANIQIRNRCDLIFQLDSQTEIEEISVPQEIEFFPDKTILLQIKGKSKNLSGTKNLSIPFIVKNLLIAPEKGLPMALNIKVTFVPEP